jgi:cation diffusion facilitator CzcD-associated flavoprotein CzcO
MDSCDVIIIGAGPYGLSAAAHLATIQGLDARIFGQPMSFWDKNMPVGMLLRSNWTATQIAGPGKGLTLEAFRDETKCVVTPPVPLDAFVRYGLWYQRKAVPEVDIRSISRVESFSGRFRVYPETGDPLEARRVVVAAGIGPFVRRPVEFSGLPSALVTHTSEHRDLGIFRGKSVLVVGSGQSALESGALLRESGASAEILGRSDQIHWLQGRVSRTLHHGLGKTMRTLLYAPTDVGPAGLSQLVARPHLLHLLPRCLQDRIRKRAVRPAGARWLVERLRGIPIGLGRQVTSAKEVGRRVTVRLSDGTERTVDHILLGTGFRPDVSKYAFLAPEIIKAIRCTQGFPHLRTGLESSVPGLHFLGAPGAWSFGPLMQFVSGTRFASRQLLRHLEGTGAERRA